MKKTAFLLWITMGIIFTIPQLSSATIITDKGYSIMAGVPNCPDCLWAEGFWDADQELLTYRWGEPQVSEYTIYFIDFTTGAAVTGSSEWTCNSDVLSNDIEGHFYVAYEVGYTSSWASLGQIHCTYPLLFGGYDDYTFIMQYVPYDTRERDNGAVSIIFGIGILIFLVGLFVSGYFYNSIIKPIHG